MAIKKKRKKGRKERVTPAERVRAEYICVAEQRMHNGGEPFASARAKKGIHLACADNTEAPPAFLRCGSTMSIVRAVSA